MDAKWKTLAVSAVVAAGCGGAALPADRLAAAEATTRGAAEIGAEQTPQASLHLKMARDQIGQAKALIKDGDNDRAGYVLSRAEVDAELALALTRETVAQAEAGAMIQEARALRQQVP
jgi:high-affinity K+ transport system ATPase subunit B